MFLRNVDELPEYATSHDINSVSSQRASVAS
jgi:hypothetical protein